MNSTASVLERIEVSPPHCAESALLERIAASRHFAKSALLSRFLRYICEFHFAGRETELTEQHIGVHVFGRPLGYDCSADNIVRNYARQLRTRLDDYYRWEGHDESLHLNVPRGGYKPVFAPIALESGPVISPVPALVATPQTGATIQAADRTAVSSRTASGWVVPALCLFGAALFGALLAAFFLRSRTTPAAALPMHSLWATVFRGDRDTVIVTADSGFGTLQDLLGRQLSLADYTGLRLGTLALDKSDRYVTRDMASQRYTSMVDLEIAMALSHRPEVISNRLSIRFARDLRMEDLKDNNVILLGSAYTNPWSELFEKNLNFALQGKIGEHSWRFFNQHPEPGEATLYEGARDGASHRTYARVAWVPNLDHDGHVLMLQGLDMAGTQAAAQSLLHGNAMADVWERSRTCNSPDASFEALLGTTSIGSNAGVIQVLATRVNC